MWQKVRAEYDEQEERLTLWVDEKVAGEAQHRGARRAGRSIITVGASRDGISNDTTHMAYFFYGSIDDVRLYDYALSTIP